MATVTASSVFLKSLLDAGITHIFVNWGSDHPALLEELQRLQTGKEKRNQHDNAPAQHDDLSRLYDDIKDYYFLPADSNRLPWRQACYYH